MSRRSFVGKTNPRLREEALGWLERQLESKTGFAHSPYRGVQLVLVRIEYW